MTARSIWPNAIMTPRHHHEVESPEDYKVAQRTFIAKNRARSPSLNWHDPWLCLDDQPVVYVSGGSWILKCGCGNAPSVHPAWRLACCFECGAIYENLRLPPDAQQIEELLMRRSHPSLRNWVPGETLADLAQQNVVLKVT